MTLGHQVSFTSTGYNNVKQTLPHKSVVPESPGGEPSLGRNRAKRKTPAKAKRGLLCPKCSVLTEVLYTRPRVGGSHRRRECPKCGFRGTTAEKWLNVSDASSTGRTPEPLSMRDLLETIRHAVSDLETSVTIPVNGATPT